MQISFRWTDGKDQDFQSFWLKTEEYYNQLVGGAGNRKAFMPYNISDNIPASRLVLLTLCSERTEGPERLRESNVLKTSMIPCMLFMVK